MEIHDFCLEEEEGDLGETGFHLLKELIGLLGTENIKSFISQFPVNGQKMNSQVVDVLD